MFRELQVGKINATIDRLQKRILERFPESGLGKICGDLHALGVDTAVRIRLIRRRNPYLRLMAWAVIIGIGGALAWILLGLDFRPFHDGRNFITFLEAAVGIVVFSGAAVLFLLTLDQRLKRRRALAAVHELRSMAHIVDMHQLTKDPERVIRKGPDTASSPERTLTPFEMQRYLDYCTEMLSMISKIGAIYVQDLSDPVVLGAVDQVETLTTGLSRKMWQKMMILDRYTSQQE